MKQYVAVYSTPEGTSQSERFLATSIIEANSFALKFQRQNRIPGRVKVTRDQVQPNKPACRKTTNIDMLTQHANTLLSSPDLTTEFKYGVIAMIEHVLHKANCYKGFMFLNWTEDMRPDTPQHASRKYF